MRKDYNNNGYNDRPESVPYGYTIAPTTPADCDNYGPGATTPGSYPGYAPTIPTDASEYRSNSNADYIPTEPFAPAEQAKTEVADLMSVAGQQVKPVVGWLVGIKGPARGKDFRLFSARNYIGRGAELEVSIEDLHISREAVVQVAYDPRSRTFLIAPCDNHNHCLSYLNDELLMGTCKLQAHDRVMIGETTELMFIPLCGADFDWKDSE